MERYPIPELGGRYGAYLSTHLHRIDTARESLDSSYRFIDS